MFSKISMNKFNLCNIKMVAISEMFMVEQLDRYVFQVPGIKYKKYNMILWKFSRQTCLSSLNTNEFTFDGMVSNDIKEGR